MRNDLTLTPWGICSSETVWNDDFLESVFFTGNGRMGVRGCLPFEPEARPVQRGLFLAGIFGEIKPGITDFVNLPTPVCDKIYIDGQLAAELHAVHRFLDMRSGVVNYKFTLGSGAKLADAEYTLFFPLERPSLLVQRLILRPRGPMELTVVSGIDISCCNCPVPDDQTKVNSQLVRLAEPVSLTSAADGADCTFIIVGGTLTVDESVRFSITGEPYRDESCVGTRFSSHGGGELCCDKLCCVRSGRDVDPRIEAMPENWNFESLLEEHRRAWEERWAQCDLALPEEELQCAVRYAMYQLTVSCSRADPTVSIGARGLTHTRYKGCYFWDTDMFMLPFYLENDITAARSLCQYRVDALPAAKKHSRSMNTLGARYPWMASLDGSEQCETWDTGCSELHITADVAYALGCFCRSTGDRNFYLDSAAEVFIETARFWLSRCSFFPEERRADLLWCKGPDEYCGVSSNNLYTNVMVQHNLDLALEAAAELHEQRPEKYRALGLSLEEREQWQLLRDCIKKPRDPLTGRLTTDDTFHMMEPVDISVLKPDDGASYHRVCFDRLQRYKVVKQADVILLMTRLPELFTDREKREAWEDFEPICLHDSTLSFASHALFALQNGLWEAGESYLRKALLLDLRDVMGNTGREGLHLACMGEAWQAARVYAHCR